MKTPVSSTPQTKSDVSNELLNQRTAESDQVTSSQNNSTVGLYDLRIIEYLKTTLPDILQKTKSTYCFAAFIDTQTEDLTKLFLASMQNFAAQRIDNANFKKFWQESFTKYTSVIENTLPVYCTITSSDSSFRVVRYATVPTHFNNSMLIFILLNKDTDYTESDILETAQQMENFKKVLELNQPSNDSVDTTNHQAILSLSERIINAQRIESIGVLSGGIAHDFNNYLTGILNFVNLAKLCTVSRQIEQYLDNTIAIINDAQKMTKQFLKYSKPGESSPTPLHIDKTLRDNISILLSGTNIRAELHVDDNLWQCNADVSQIEQMFASIIINAREAMPEGGFINIAITNEHITTSETLPLPEGNYVKIQVTDNGCGIPSEIQSKVFSSYFTTKFGRSGFGLTSAMMIAKNHKGHITMSSEVNTGSVFTVYLPSAVTPANGSSSSNDQGARGKILLMDDEYFIRHTASEILKKKNFSVVTATQGHEAVELFKNAHFSEAPFDVVILDLTVPDGMGGIETLKKLAEIDPEVKAIASSGYSDDPVISEPEKYGFSGSLGKPYNLNEFINAIKDVIFREL